MSRPRPDRRRILLLTEGRTTPLSAKTATGVIRYGRGRVVGQRGLVRGGAVQRPHGRLRPPLRARVRAPVVRRALDSALYGLNF